ncbi:MAG: hypothetical protein ACO1Q7_04150, partial [Gemmatimonas sp.]
MLLLAALATLTFAADATATRALASLGLPSREPAAVGMSAARLASIDRIVQRGITAGGYPG